MRHLAITLACSAILFSVACSSGGDINRIRGTACKPKANPFPLEVKGASKVSMTSLDQTGEELGLPVGTFVYTGMEFYSSTPTDTSLKAISVRGSHFKNNKNEWDYSTACARIGLKDELEAESFIFPALISVEPNGTLEFEEPYVGTISFQHKIGFKFDIEESQESIDSFQKAFILRNGSLNFVRLKDVDKKDKKHIYEIRFVNAEDSAKKIQFVVRFKHFTPDEQIPEDLVYSP